MHAPNLRISMNGRYLQTEEGTPFFWLGDTCWAATARSTSAEWEQYIAVRSHQGFTVLQLNSLAQYDSAQPVWGQRIAFPQRPDGSLDFARPRADYFDYLKDMVRRANGSGLVAAVVVVWFNYIPNARAWTVPQPRPEMTIAEAKRYAAFLAEHLRGLKVVWLLTGDDTYREEGVVPFTRELGAFLKQCDPNHRLITLHPSQQAGRLFHGCAWLDFEMVQSSHFDAYLELAYELVEEQWRLVTPKPIVNGEICYERHHGADWGHKFDRRDIRKAFWWSVLSGALGGVTYGADGVWQWKRPGETNWYPGGNEVLSWNDALALPAVRDLARARELLSQLKWWRLSPAQQRLKQRPLRHVSISAAEDGSLLLAYLPAMPPTVGEVELDTSGLSRDAHAAWWDPETGTIQLLGGITNGCMLFTPPDERDAILIIGPSDSLQECRQMAPSTATLAAHS